MLSLLLGSCAGCRGEGEHDTQTSVWCCRNYVKVSWESYSLYEGMCWLHGSPVSRCCSEGAVSGRGRIHSLIVRCHVGGWLGCPHPLCRLSPHCVTTPREKLSHCHTRFESFTLSPSKKGHRQSAPNWCSRLRTVRCVPEPKHIASSPQLARCLPGDQP